MLSLRYLPLLILLFTGGIAQATSTALYLQSQGGDFVGQGNDYAYVAPTDTFQVISSASGIQVFVQSWMLNFTPSTGKTFAKGVYENAQSFPFTGPSTPGMSVSGIGRSCDRVTGRFEIFDLKTDSSGNITSFALQFEQHCEGAAPALFGQLLYNADKQIGPRVSIAAASALKGDTGTADALIAVSLSRPSHDPVSVSYATVDGTAQAGRDYVATQGIVTFPRGATTQYATVPIIGNRVVTKGSAFKIELSTPENAPLGIGSARVTITDPNGPLTVLAMNSQPGDPLGGGVPWLETVSYTSFNTSLTTSLAAINLGWPDMWALYFAPPSGTTLSPGFYANAQRYPFQPANVPGLSVYGDGVGCNTITGSFAINDISIPHEKFSADFEQDCDGISSGDLFGSIRINEVLQQISITNAVITNGNADFTITVNPASPYPVYAYFSTVDGTATAGVNYTATSGLVKIPAASAETKVHVKLIGKPPRGKVFYGVIEATSLPPVWISAGAAHL